MHLRPAGPADRPGVDAVIRAAFGEEGDQVAQMVRDLDAASATRASIVAVSDEVVVGHVQLSRSWIDARRALVEVLTLSPLSVAPDRQGEGVGTALVAAALEAAENLELPAVFLEGDWRYYGRRGFSAATPLGFRRPSVRIPEPAFQVAVLGAHEDWMVGGLVYPEPMWANDCVGLRDPELGEIESRLPG